MHAMGAMPPMGGVAPVHELGGGRYRADFELRMGSTWQVEVRATAGAGEIAAEGALTVGTPGLRLEAAGAAADAAPPSQAAADERHPAEFALPPGRAQQIGVRTARAERRPMAATIRALGIVSWDETRLEDVSLKVRGWVGALEVDALGDPVARGQVLFSLYSPELYAAQEEYLQALRSQQRALSTPAPERADYLVRAARNRLRLWDVAEAEIEALARRGEPFEYLPIRSPRSGFVIEKDVVQGSGIEAGQRLYRIAPLDRIWIEAEVYESELGLVAVGQNASVELPYQVGVRHEAQVAYVYPVLSRGARTARVRLELANPGLRLRPDMYANVRIDVDRGERLVVPQSAVLRAGERNFVFLALDGGRFRPEPVEVGLEIGDHVEILSGLEEGASVVASATFLIASESRLRAALEQW
jgi:Cu(I)/Ag(I) efflux system membrane fusion protein